MNLVLRATAIKMSNKGGGVQAGRKDTGSDYVTFVCPAPNCKHRNKMSMYESENYSPANEDRIPFRCRMCRTVIEVQRPAAAVRLIISPADFSRETAHRRRDFQSLRS